MSLESLPLGVPARGSTPSRVPTTPDGMGAYRFAVLAGLRAVQLMRGCTPRVDRGAHKLTVVAQLEIMEGKTEELVVDDDA